MIVTALLFFNKAVAQKHVPVFTYYDVQKKIMKEHFFVFNTKKKDVKDSSYTSFFDSGSVKMKGSFAQNAKTGRWYFYYENAGLKVEGDYAQDQQQGLWIYYFENGNKSAEGYYLNNLKQGNWKYYFESGDNIVKSEGEIRDNLKQGLWLYYNEAGTFKAQADFVNDEGIYNEFYENKNIKSTGKIVGNKSEGEWIYFHENGNIYAKGNEVHGLKEGEWLYYNEYGYLSSKGSFQNGKQSGTWTYYYADGSVATQGSFQNNLKDGDWISYDVSGKKIGETNFKNGTGTYREFFDNGKLKIEGPVVNNQNEGLWKYYYESGELEGECFYSQGKGKYVGYYKNGHRKMEGMLENGNKKGVWKLYDTEGNLAGLYKTYFEEDTLSKRLDSLYLKTLKDTTYKSKLPSFTAPKKKSRYFSPRVNEFKAYIIGGNPVALLRKMLPLSIEWYYQERIGYELGLIYLSKPMFESHLGVKENTIYYRGVQLFARQKFYQKDKNFGMLYFAHEFRYGITNISNNIKDTTVMNPVVETKNMLEQTFEYSVLIGDRLIKDSRRNSFTFDVFIGIGIGYRYIERDYDENVELYNKAFSNVNQSTIKFPFRFGFTLGYVIPMSK
jgi:antitoxin component YwqK of YwqJK toxin-antitoxin module